MYGFTAREGIYHGTRPPHDINVLWWDLNDKTIKFFNTQTVQWEVYAANGNTYTPDLYTNETPMPEAVGGYDAGTTFSGRTMQQMLDGLLYRYQLPAFTNFKLTNFQASRYEVGTVISPSQRFEWSITNIANAIATVTITGQNIASPVTAATAAGFADITLSSPLTRTSAGTYSWLINSQNTKGAAISRSNAVRWDWKQYWGISTQTSLTEAQIKALQSNRVTQSNVTGAYAFDATGYKYFVFADDAAYTKPSSFLNTQTGFAVQMYNGFSNTQNGISYDLVNVTNANGITKAYRVYRTAFVLDAAINVQIT